MSVTEIVITAAIIAVIIVMWRVGRANPVDTGTLEKDLGATKRKLARLEGKVDAAATSEELEEVRGKIATIEERVKHLSSKADVARVEKSLEHVCKQNDRTEEAVVRIEQFLMGQPK